MSDYETTPVYRERKRRRKVGLLEQAARIFSVVLGAMVLAFALLTLVGLVLMLAGCTTLTAEQQRELALQAKGCYCTGTGCDEIKSAAGQAAVAAAGGQVVNITKVEKPKQ